MPLWFHVPLVLSLALASWISGMDATGDPDDTLLLWTVTIAAAGALIVRLARRLPGVR